MSVRRGRYQTAAYFAAFIGLGLTTASLGPTLSALATQTRVGLSTVSYLFMARSLGYIGGSRTGKLFDRFPGNKLLAATLLLMAILMTTISFAGNFPLLVALMVLLGIAESSLDLGANVLLVWSNAKHAGPPLLNALHSFYGVGALVSPVVLAALISAGYQAVNVYIVLGMMLLPVAGWLWRLPGPTPRQNSEMTRQATGSTRLAYLIALFLFIYVGAEVGFTGWLFTYATVLKLSSEAGAAYLTSSFWVALTLGRFLSVPLAKRFDQKSILTVNVLGGLGSVALILIFPGSLVALIVGVVGLGLFMAPVFPTLISYASDKLHLTGQMTGRFIMGASLGAMLVPLTIGQLFESSARVVPLFAAAMLVLMGIVLFALFRLRSPSPMSKVQSPVT